MLSEFRAKIDFMRSIVYERDSSGMVCVGDHGRADRPLVGGLLQGPHDPLRL